MLHGRGYDRWFDKSLTLVVCSNGKVSRAAAVFLIISAAEHCGVACSVAQLSIAVCLLQLSVSESVSVE